jgi:non-homologous end joining protein Ku
MLVINSLLSILSIGLPVARKHGKITVHVTLSYNMDVGHQRSIISGRPIDKIDNEELMTNIHVVGEGHMYCNLTMFSCHWKTNRQNR